MPDARIKELEDRVAMLEEEVERDRTAHNELSDCFIELVNASRDRAIEVDKRLDALEGK